MKRNRTLHFLYVFKNWQKCSFSKNSQILLKSIGSGFYFRLHTLCLLYTIKLIKTDNLVRFIPGSTCSHFREGSKRTKEIFLRRQQRAREHVGVTSARGALMARSKRHVMREIEICVSGGKKRGRVWIRHATTQLASGIPARSEYNSRSKIEDYSAMRGDVVASHLSVANDWIAGPLN